MILPFFVKMCRIWEALQRRYEKMKEKKVPKQMFDLLAEIFKENRKGLKFMLGEKAIIITEINNETVEIRIEFDCLINNKEKLLILQAINEAIPVLAVSFNELQIKFPSF
ncbi:hypothetical protein J7L36_00890 [bacterium]|nr:hypothetical protein [bacterium]